MILPLLLGWCFFVQTVSRFWPTAEWAPSQVEPDANKFLYSSNKWCNVSLANLWYVRYLWLERYDWEAITSVLLPMFLWQSDCGTDVSNANAEHENERHCVADFNRIVYGPDGLRWMYWTCRRWRPLFSHISGSGPLARGELIFVLFKEKTMTNHFDLLSFVNILYFTWNWYEKEKKNSSYMAGDEWSWIRHRPCPPHVGVPPTHRIRFLVHTSDCLAAFKKSQTSRQSSSTGLTTYHKRFFAGI